MRRSEFIATDRGRRSRHQAQVIECLKQRQRLAFRGPVVLSLALRTTDRNPAHIHTIAKNLLDLLGKPLTGLQTGRRGLVYFDDGQIEGLVVRCEHGAEAPEISIEALPISDFRDDLALGVYAADSIEDERWEDGQEKHGSSLDLADLARDRETILSGRIKSEILCNSASAVC